MARVVPSSAALHYIAFCLRPAKPGFSASRICRATRCQRQSAAQAVVHSVRSRTFVTSTTRHATYNPLNSPPDTPPTGEKRVRTRVGKDAIEQEFTINEDIPTRQVQLKDPQTGKLLEPQALSLLLRTIDRNTEVVQALATPPDMPAIVEITTRDALLDRLKQKEIKAANLEKVKRDSKPKQIELNWAISGNDLDLKLKQLRQFVEKGKKVEILLAAKKRQRKATPEEANHVVQEIRKTVGEINGCRELKPMDGKIGAQALMTVGKAKG
ncbi:hypothetical protein PMZ80_009297 [Knufia obscura]|uniref:Translation initiation factor IF-3 n=2 Tax=Knufia TaxID=430999 RepID=A0AAN8EHM7_9EURO|nr:hypothetical protein PMZ80_009297 [Knufia obscura]KAK5955758.1 hypothetical protein OHC33_003399 [Knufia fluminis]